jgi:predicted transcriptional regulator of viral defense system
MKYGLLVKKLNLIDKNIIVSDDLKSYCSILKMEYLDAIKYLIRHKYLHRIMRGIFYNPSIRERKMGGFDITYREAIVKALEIKGVNDWYFGLETALKLNNLTHEFFVVDYILNDKISRRKSLEVFGNKIKFVKVKPKLCKLGIKKLKYMKFSDVEKTILDFVYLLKYRGFSDAIVKNKIIDYLEFASKEKLLSYSKKYNKKVEEFVRSL